MWNSLILGGLEGVWGPGTISTVWSVMTITTLATLKHSAFLDFFFLMVANIQIARSYLGQLVRYMYYYSKSSLVKKLFGGENDVWLLKYEADCFI